LTTVEIKHVATCSISTAIWIILEFYYTTREILLKRSLYTQPENWKIDSERKHLLLRGAKKVRKAFILINLIFITSMAYGDTTRVSELPEAKLRMLDGEYSQLSQYVGNGPLIIDFWTTW
jgi:hypothetical protein